ncbi:hypothetical protein SALBM135S_06365 [Streptomyces alboniger]
MQHLKIAATPSGGVIARRRSSTRPSRLVALPFSSAHCVARQHHVRQFGRLGEHHVADGEEVQRARPGSSTCAARGAETTGLNPITSSDLMSVPSTSSSSYALRPGPGSESGSTPGALGDVPPRRRVGQLAVARQLVGLLAVFAPALPVALPGQTAVPGQRPPGPPVARHRLIHAPTVSVPLDCCSGPRAVSTIAASGAQNSRTASRSSGTDAP